MRSQIACKLIPMYCRHCDASYWFGSLHDCPQRVRNAKRHRDPLVLPNEDALTHELVIPSDFVFVRRADAVVFNEPYEIEPKGALPDPPPFEKVRWVKTTHNWQSREWKELRRACLERDGRRCTSCGTNKKQLDAHHRIARKDGGEDHLDNLIMLCVDCHADQHPELSRVLFTRRASKRRKRRRTA